MRKSEVLKKVSPYDYTLIREILELGGVSCQNYYCQRRPTHRINCPRCCAEARRAIRVIKARLT